MILQIFSKVWDAKMLCILTDLYHGHIYRKKDGHRRMEILELLSGSRDRLTNISLLAPLTKMSAVL